MMAIGKGPRRAPTEDQLYHILHCQPSIHVKNPHKLDPLQGASHADGNPVSYNFVVPELPLDRRAEICHIFCKPITININHTTGNQGKLPKKL